MSPPNCSSTSRTTCFVLAGGLGERLRPLTLSVPKPLLQFGGVHRLLDFTLANVVNSSLRRTYVLTQYLAASVGAYLRASSYPLSGIHHQPPTSGKRYRSTADSVAQNLTLAPSDSDLILVLSADHVYRMDYQGLIADHIRQGAGVTVAAVPVPLVEARQLGVLSIDASATGGTVLDFAEKPEWPNPMPGMGSHALSSMGVYLFDRGLLSEALANLHDLVPGPDFGRDVIPYFVERRLASAYLATDPNGSPLYWRDVGTLQSYYDANMDALRDRTLAPTRRSPVARPEAIERAGGRSRKLESSIVAPSVLLGDCRIEQSILSSGVIVEDGADVRDSILLPGAQIGRGAFVRNAIVNTGSAVPAGDGVGCRTNSDRETVDVTNWGQVVVPSYPNDGLAALCELVAFNRVPRPISRHPIESLSHYL